jgi:hypothetical protein
MIVVGKDLRFPFFKKRIYIYILVKFCENTSRNEEESFQMLTAGEGRRVGRKGFRAREGVGIL